MNYDEQAIYGRIEDNALVRRRIPARRLITALTRPTGTLLSDACDRARSAWTPSTRRPENAAEGSAM